MNAGLGGLKAEAGGLGAGADGCRCWRATWFRWKALAKKVSNLQELLISEHPSPPTPPSAPAIDFEDYRLIVEKLVNGMDSLLFESITNHQDSFTLNLFGSLNQRFQPLGALAQVLSPVYAR